MPSRKSVLLQEFRRRGTGAAPATIAILRDRELGEYCDEDDCIAVNGEVDSAARLISDLRCQYLNGQRRLSTIQMA
jgi:hypothetical protein